MTIKIVMDYHKDTPHKFRYSASDKDAPIQEIYITKQHFKGKQPDSILLCLSDIG